MLEKHLSDIREKFRLQEIKMPLSNEVKNGSSAGAQKVSDVISNRFANTTTLTGVPDIGRAPKLVVRTSTDLPN